MTAPLRFPIRREAPAPLDDVSVQRLWRGVVARRLARRYTPGRGAFLWLAIGALAGTLLTVGVVLPLRNRARVETQSMGPLMLSDGKPLGVTVATTGESTTAHLADDSNIVLEPGTRLEPLENNGHALSLLVVMGHATFDVHPGGPRRWSFECGLATVEVVGTKLSIDRSPDALVVAVEHGVVLVRGDRVPDRVRRLRAGERIEIHAGDAVTHAAPADAPAAPSASGTVSEHVPVVSAHHDAWRDLSTRGDYAGAYRALGPSGVGAASSASQHVDDLMALSDVARLSGHSGDAVVPLGRVVREFPADPRASLAAFTLGKIHLAEPGSGGLAARDFSDAIRLGLPSSLTEDAYANQVDALRRAGDDARARAAATDYVARFPASPRAVALAAWASAR
ncbi:MAG TPA: FecR family protein [Polyangiaceae bacterium]|nr:FecR family protein [Polyangiaceae bacterium]